jgi:4-hydroxythreonine-4-phosphate dehydrogenase
MPRVLIIADDLSGAADCASAFFKAGLETLVVIDRDAGQSADTAAAQVIAIDADTRRLPGAEAAEIQLAVLERYRAAGPRLYKKIDSTLRGNFAQELGAFIARVGLAIVAPAFPQAGRFTRGGHQFLHATPLELTETWTGEGIAGTAHVPSMLARHGIRTASIGVEEIRQGPKRLGALFETRAGDGVQALVCDVEADIDLDAIVQASIPLTMPRFWVGSAGLASHLAAAARVPAGPAAPVVTRGAILTVVGSFSSVSRAQAGYLSARGPVERIDVPAGLLRLGQAHPHWRELCSALEMSLQKDRDPLLTIATEVRADMGEGSQLCRALGLLIAPLAGHIGAAIFTGGETARAILSAMGATGLRLAGEIEPGVPLSVATGIKPIPVITKAGAFGARETLFHCHEILRRTRVVSACAANIGPNVGPNVGPKAGPPIAGSTTQHGKNT